MRSSLHSQCNIFCFLEKYVTEQLDVLQEEERKNQLILEDQIESYESATTIQRQEHHLERDVTNGEIDLCADSGMMIEDEEEEVVHCPLCHVGILTSGGDPYIQGDFYCDSNKCKFAHGARFGKQWTLSGLKYKLMMAYMDHSTICNGSLQFDLKNSSNHDDNDGSSTNATSQQSGLVAGCSDCRKMVLIAPAAPIVHR